VQQWHLNEPRSSKRKDSQIDFNTINHQTNWLPIWEAYLFIRTCSNRRRWHPRLWPNQDHTHKERETTIQQLIVSDYRSFDRKTYPDGVYIQTHQLQTTGDLERWWWGGRAQLLAPPLQTLYWIKKRFRFVRLGGIERNLQRGHRINNTIFVF